MNSLGHRMSKALNLVWGVWRNETDWDPNWGLTGLTRPHRI
jgi:hypothetical protein